MKKNIRALLIASIMLFSLSGCSTPPPVDSTKKTAVATFFPYYVFTKNLAGDYLNVELLITNQTEPHDYQFKPSDLALIQRADLIIKNGLGMDDWIDGAIEASDSKATTLIASEGLNLLAPQETQEVGHDEDEEDAHGHEDLPFDPHVWVSPKNVLQILPKITAELIKLAPEHEVKLEELLVQYSQKIKTLDEEIGPKFAQLPTTDFVSFHPAIQYFARDYGIRNRASLETYPGEEPTPYYLKQLSDFIKGSGITVITTEPQFSPRLVETLARDLQLKVISFDPLETGLYTPSVYQDTMRANVEALVAALSS